MNKLYCRSPTVWLSTWIETPASFYNYWIKNRTKCWSQSKLKVQSALSAAKSLVLIKVFIAMEPDHQHILSLNSWFNPVVVIRYILWSLYCWNLVKKSLRILVRIYVYFHLIMDWIHFWPFVSVLCLTLCLFCWVCWVIYWFYYIADLIELKKKQNLSV